MEDVTFYRPDTGFTVLDLNSEGELVTVVGVLPALSAGEELRLMGHWDVHASFGRQFRAELCERSLPSTAGQLLKYLSSGAVKGIRAATAEKIVEAFGDRTSIFLKTSRSASPQSRASPGKKRIKSARNSKNNLPFERW